MRALFVVLVLSACGAAKPTATPAPPPPPATPLTDDEVIAKMTTFYSEIGSASATLQPDCPKMAAALDKAITDRFAVIDEMAAWVRATPPPQRQAAVDKHANEILEASNDYVRVTQLCKDEPAMITAVQKLERRLKQ